MTSEKSAQYRILRPLETEGLEAASVAVQILEPHGCVTIWPGIPPQLPADIHPMLARPLGQTTIEDMPCWVEERANTSSLVDLALPLTIATAAHVVAGVADALDALHARGRAHGAINMDTVVLDLENQAQVLGVGIRAGSIEADLASCVALFDSLSDTPELPTPESASQLAEMLREIIAKADDPEPMFTEQVTTATRPMSGHIVSLSLQPIGVVDEVQHDIGRDEKGRGLLDRWSTTNSVDDMTDDRTESVDASELYERSRKTMLERVDALYAAADQGDRLPENTACAAVGSLVNQEPLDPLPIPEGIPHGPLMHGDDEDDRTAEVTASPLDVADPPTDEEDEPTAGFDGYGTRLMMAGVVGMVGATAVLAVVWAALTFFPF